jgi:hypothetical protein
MFVSTKQIACATVGSLAFWMPSVVVHAVVGPAFSSKDIRLIAYLQIIAMLAALGALWFLRGQNNAPKRIALWMLMGIWMLGPLWLFIGATFSEGGFAKEGAWLALIIATVLFPIFTLLLSVYDGSVVSLLVVTLLLALVCIDVRAIFRKEKT